ncbi:MAG: glycerophosphodiester phosphodiesterase family protein [Acidobacteriota bacterium]
MSIVPLIIGHRGASAHAPENTLAAFQMAIAAGADGIEFDVQLSRDGVPMVIHDATLERTGGRPEAVADLTADELASVDAGSWFGPKFRGERIPTLSEVLELCRGMRRIYIELKVNVPDFAPLAAAVCDTIRSSPDLPQMIVKSFRLGAIPLVRQSLPEVQTAALFEPTILDYLRRRKFMLALAREFGAHQISIHHSLITRKLTRLADEVQMPVTVWTTDNPKWVRRAQARGIAALITNDPKRLLRERASLTAEGLARASTTRTS